MNLNIYFNNTKDYHAIKKYLESNKASSVIDIEASHNDTLLSCFSKYVVEVKLDDENSIVTYYQMFDKYNCKQVNEADCDDVLYEIERNSYILDLVSNSILWH